MSAIGVASITGTATEDSVLSASVVDTDGTVSSTFSYQWKRGAVVIIDANNINYTLVQGDVGSTITVTVDYIDDLSNAESVTSVATSTVTNINDVPVGNPVITGAASEGVTLGVDTLGISDEDGGVSGFSYLWKRNATPVGSASTYTLVQADVGNTLTVTVSYVDGGNTTETLTSAATATVTNTNDVPVGDPVITGAASEGVTLGVNTSGISDEDGGVSGFSYLWKRNVTPVGSASTYTLVQADVGNTLTVTVSYVDGGNTTETLTSAATATVTNTNDVPVGEPVITGVASEGATLGVNTSGISDEDGGVIGFSYLWKRGVTPVGSASTYTLVQADVGNTLTVTVSYVDGGNTTETLTSAATATVTNTNDVPVGEPVITGAASEGVTLGVNTSGISDADGLGVFSYQWLRNGNVITGAIASTYTLVQLDVAAFISVNVSYTDAGNTRESVTSAPTATVVNVNDLPVGVPVISGIALQNEVLTAVTAGISDADGLGVGGFNYQWLRSGEIIVGATASTYTLVQLDVGAFISLNVSYTDAGNTRESVTSAQTAAVINVNDLPVGVPIISGIALQNEVLTAVTAGISDADGLGTGGFRYQWLRSGEIIIGATTSTYTLVQLDVGAFISLNVRYTDGDLAEESVTSAPTIAVVNVNDLPAGVPIISGSVIQGGQLAVDVSGITDIDGLGLFSYQWLRDGVTITGATAEVYTLIQADVNSFIRVVVSYTDAGLTDESVTSNALGPVGNINDIGVVTIVGQAIESSTLTVESITDADGTSSSIFVYQWMRDGAAIAGATGNSYFLAEGENLRTFITLRVTYTDDFGANEVVDSNTKGPIFPDVPNVIPPATVGPKNATGWFTPVDINPAAATATDGFEGALTPVSDSTGQFRPGVTIVTWSATDIAGNVGTATQEVHVIPLAEVSKIQRSAEGSSAEFKIVLNGEALQYPVTVPYSVSNSDLGTGSANSRDHNLVAASATIAEPGIPGELPEAVIAFNIADDGLGEGMESLIITLVDTPELVHAVLGSNTEHTVEIVEGNVPPLVSLEATQVQVDLSTGLVSVFAVVTDANNGDSFSYDWSITDNAVFAIGSVVADGVFSFNSADLTPGFYTLRVAVNDGTETVESALMLNVQAVLPALSTADSDGDGVNDEAESYADKDSDGIADYLDAIQAGSVIQILPGISDKFIMQTEAGLKLSLGDVAYATDSGASLVEQGDITDYIDIVNLGLGDNLAVDEIDNVGGYFDFTVSGLSIAGQSVRVVVPQLAQMPRSSAYRKLTKAGWQDYVEDENNSVASAVGAEGYCPPPGHSDYIPGLTQGHWCLQLTIEDGGPNDSDGLANNSVTDPGGLGRILTDISVSSSGGGGAWHPLLPALSIFIMLFFRNVKYLPGR